MSFIEFVRRVLFIFLLILLALAFWRLRTILMLAFLSVVIAVSLSIPVVRLQQMGIRRPLAITYTLLGIVVAISLFLLAILPNLVVQVGAIFEDFPEAYQDLRLTYNGWYLRQGELVHRVLPWLDDEQINNVISGTGDFLSSAVTGVSGAVLGVVANLVIVIVVAVFLLIDPSHYLRGLVLVTPPHYRDRLLEIMVELKSSLVAWLSALTFSISITTVLVWVLLGGVWGVPNALGLGVIAGLMTIIPNIGAIVPAIPIAIFTLADDPAKLPFVMLTYLGIQQLESNVLTPTIVRRQMDIPAAAIFLFQLIAASLFGFFGVLMAVPLLATLITLVRETYVYDSLHQRGVNVELEYSESGGIRLITVTPSEEPGQTKVRTKTYELMDSRHTRPEDFMLERDQLIEDEEAEQDLPPEE